MDKQNIFRSCDFHADSGDIVHVLVKDLVGVLPDIELVDGQGNAEDAYPDYADVMYGALYNWYAATNARNICSLEWRVPTVQDLWDLMIYLDPVGVFDNNIAGIQLKDSNNTYWELVNNGTNNVGFNGRGSGIRNAATGGTFINLGRYTKYWTSIEYITTDAYHGALYSAFYANPLPLSFVVSNPTNLILEGQTTLKASGISIRLIKNSTALTHGQTGTYIGNDGKTYDTVCIGTQEWLSSNLNETKYRDGTDIPIITINGNATQLITGWTNEAVPNGFDTCTSVGRNITSLVDDGSEASVTAYSNFFACTAGDTLKIIVNTTINAGVVPTFAISSAHSPLTYYTLAAGSTTFYHTITNTENYRLYLFNTLGLSVNCANTFSCQVYGWVNDTDGAMCYYNNDISYA